MARHRPAVLHAIHSKQLTKVFDYKTVLYYMPRTEAALLHVELVMMS